MKGSSNTIVIGIIILLFAGSFNIPISENRSYLQHETQQPERNNVLSLTPSDPITITSNGDFLSQGWPGNGTEGDPYLIEDLEFTSPDTSISIRNTDVYFTINGCSFNGISQNQGRAIDLTYVSNGTVNTCFFHNIQFGVWIEYSDNLTIVNNDGDYVGYGVFCKYSNNLTISENTVIDARDEGIGTYYCDDCVIHGNSVTNCGDYGLWLYELYNSFVTNNTVTHCGYRAIVEESYPNSYGIGVRLSFNNTIVGNYVTDSKELGMDLSGDSHTLIDNHFSANGPWGDIVYWNGDDSTFINNTLEQGIMMHISTASKMEGNTAAGKPIGYFDSLSSTSINISTYGQVILDNCNSVEVHSGVFTDVVVGIHLHQSVNCMVNNVNISNAREGIRLRFSSDCECNATTITGSISHGISNYQSEGTSVFNSEITESGGSGIRVDWSNNCNITSNRFVDNADGGLCVYDSWYTYMKNNSFYGDGLVIYSQDTSGYDVTSINNMVNENPLGYFYNEIGGGVTNTEFGQLIVAYCDQFIVDNCNVTNASNGVTIAQSTDCTIQNSNFRMNTLRGVWDFFSTGTTISNCIISENGNLGIEMIGTEFTSIEENLILNNQGDGIDIGSSDYLSMEDNQIIGNQGHGFICDWPQTWTVYRNNISYNGDDGIVLWHGWNVDVQNNIVTNNVGDGFFLDETEFCTFTGNWLMDNGGYEFYLNSQCDSNTLYNNTIGDSCRDDGTNDQWDNGVNLGNIWYDYYGVGDYYVSGSGGGVDHYPRVLDFDDPIISSPIDFIVEQWIAGNFIQWTVSDKIPVNYTVYRNSTIYHTSEEVTSVLNIDISSDLDLGSHNFTIIVYDFNGNFGTDTVFVTVEDTLPPSINSPADVYYVLDEINNVIDWNGNDPNPGEYSIYFNGTLTKSGLWNSSAESISINVDGLGIGSYNYTILLSDSFGHESSDVVFVIVTEEPIITTTNTTTTITTGATNTTGTTTEDDGFLSTFSIVIAIGSLTIIIVVIVLIYRSKDAYS